MGSAPNDSVQPVAEDEDVVAIENDVDALIEDDLLVEDVSIDGMCGVY